MAVAVGPGSCGVKSSGISGVNAPRSIPTATGPAMGGWAPGEVAVISPGRIVVAALAAVMGAFAVAVVAALACRRPMARLAVVVWMICRAVSRRSATPS